MAVGMPALAMSWPTLAADIAPLTAAFFMLLEEAPSAAAFKAAFCATACTTALTWDGALGATWLAVFFAVLTAELTVPDTGVFVALKNLLFVLDFTGVCIASCIRGVSPLDDGRVDGPAPFSTPWAALAASALISDPEAPSAAACTPAAAPAWWAASCTGADTGGLFIITWADPSKAGLATGVGMPALAMSCPTLAADVAASTAAFWILLEEPPAAAAFRAAFCATVCTAALT